MVRACVVETADRRLSYLESGAGWPVVLLHAFPLTAEMWRPQLEGVPEGWRFIAPDLPGFGESSGFDGTTPSMEGFATAVDLLLDALEIDRAVIGGESMGGYVAFALHRIAPARFTGMILSSTRAQADTPEGLAARTSMSDLVRASGPSAVADQMLPKLLGETTHRANPQLVSRVRRMIESNTTRAIDDAIRAMMRRPDSTPQLSRISVPALIVSGDEDTVVPRADAELLDRCIPRSLLVVLPRAGHLSNLEAPDDFSLAVRDFLSANI
jgi:3-oxoadipate enol-lactonase